MKKAILLSFVMTLLLGTINAQNIVAKASPSAWEHPRGKYAVVMAVDATLPNHTIYRPSDLTAFPYKDKMPILVMSGSGCDFDVTHITHSGQRFCLLCYIGYLSRLSQIPEDV